MIRIYVTQRVAPENADAFEALAKELVAGSLAEEGNVDYSINKSIQDAGLYAIFEVWASMEALKVHQETEHYTRLIPQINEVATMESFGLFSQI